MIRRRKNNSENIFKRVTNKELINLTLQNKQLEVKDRHAFEIVIILILKLS